jgi:hypothetical protein
MSWRLLCFAVLVAVVALTALAEATPPDQTWIGGFYDNADYDDVVLKITNAMGAVDIDLSGPLHPISIVISIVPQRCPEFVQPAALPSSPSRAPPTT